MTTPGEAARRATAVSLAVGFLGVVSLAVAAWAAPLLPAPAGDPGLAGPIVVALIVVAAAALDVFSVPLWHGDEHEDLTFFEVTLVAAVLVVSPLSAIVAPLAGAALALVILRPGWVKASFNLGMYAAAWSVSALAYLALTNGTPRFELRSVVALVLSMMLWVLINTVFLAWVLNTVQGTARVRLFRDLWGLSVLMALVGVAAGAVAVALASTFPVLVPFTGLPVLALWYAYRAAAQHARARERNRWLVVVATSLAAQGSTDELLSVAPDAIRAAVGAPEVEVVVPPDPDAHRFAASPCSVLAPQDRPKGWTYGVSVALDVDGTGAGVLLLGAAEGGREWRLESSDEPMLIALAASLSSAMRGARDRESLVQETGKLKAVVEHATDGIVVVGDDGLIQMWSPAMELISGASAAEVDASLDDAQPASARLLVAAAGLPGMLYEPGMAGEAPPFPGLALPTRESLLLGLTRPDGEIREVQVSIVRIQDEVDGGQVAILTVHDVTRERRTDRLKADFVATISHELRTPITPIKGYAELLLHRGDELPAEKRHRALELIAERADHLGRLVDDLLLASRVTGEAASGLATRKADDDLVHLVRTAVGAFPSLESRIELHVPDQPVEVHCDPVRTKQCLTNLLSNAGKYSPAGSVVVVTLDVPDPAAGRAVVSVQDNGPGIPEPEQDRVFDRFYRLGDPMTMTTGGSGLGLYIARELARAQGGDLTLVSSAGSGCTFSLHVPLVAAAVASVPDPGPSPYPTARESR